MSKVRWIFSMMVAIAMMGGYVASQYAYFTQQYQEYSNIADSTLIATLSLLVLVACIGLAVKQDKPEEDDEQK